MCYSQGAKSELSAVHTLSLSTLTQSTSLVQPHRPAQTVASLKDREKSAGHEEALRTPRDTTITVAPLAAPWSRLDRYLICVAAILAKLQHTAGLLTEQHVPQV